MIEVKQTFYLLYYFLEIVNGSNRDYGELLTKRIFGYITAFGVVTNFLSRDLTGGHPNNTRWVQVSPVTTEWTEPSHSSRNLILAHILTLQLR
jgi:hypothetical protein